MISEMELIVADRWTAVGETRIADGEGEGFVPRGSYGANRHAYLDIWKDFFYNFPTFRNAQTSAAPI